MANDSPATRARKILRPEAAPLPWSDLDGGQQKAFERLLDFIAAAVHDLGSARQPQREESAGYLRPPDWLDHYRDNRTVLLDGVRGIGKTSVLLSVINACTRGDRTLDRSLEPEKLPPLPESSKDTGGAEDKSAAKLKEKLAEMRTSVKSIEAAYPEDKSVEELEKKCAEIARDIDIITQREDKSAETLAEIVAEIKKLEAEIERTKDIKRIERERIESENARRARIKENLNDIRCRLLWLEPLDMEPLPGPTNLLAAVLARIEGLARSFVFPDTKNVSERRGPAGILESCPDSLGALQEFQRLQSDVALAWDGNLPARGAHLDPDTYAVEVLRAEGARVSLNRNLRSALDALADTVFRGCGVHNPLFVLPVDDVDLYPARCLEILRLLRMIMVPRLLTIVLGSLDLIELVLNLKYSGEFSALANADSPHDLISIQPERVRSKAGSVSANAMRKLLPFAQRIRLGRMNVLETLNYRPSSPVVRSDLPRLHELLANCPVSLPTISDQNIENLRDFLLFPAPESIVDGRDVTQAELNRCSYSALDILHMAPRHAADSWQSLKVLATDFKVRQMTAREKQKDSVNLLGLYARSAINEDDELPADLRQKYRERLRLDPSTGTWQLFEPMTLYPDGGAVNTIELPAERFVSPVKILLRANRGWRLYAGRLLPFAVVVDGDQLGAQIIELKDSSSFSAHTAHALRLLHDLLALGTGWELMQRRMDIHLTLEIWAVSEWRASEKRNVYIPWPAPRFFSTWGYDIFLSGWNEAVHRVEKREIEEAKAGAKTVRYCIFAWIDAAAATLSLEQPILWDATIPSTLDWPELVGRVTKLLGINDARRGLIDEWLTRLAYFLMPEICGVLVEETEKTPEAAVTQQSLLEVFYKTQQRLCVFWATRSIEIGQYVTEIKGTLSKKEVGMSKEGTEIETAWKAYSEKIARQAQETGGSK